MTAMRKTLVMLIVLVYFLGSIQVTWLGEIRTEEMITCVEDEGQIRTEEMIIQAHIKYIEY